MVKKIIWITLTVVVVGSVLFFAIDGSAKKEDGYKTVTIEKGNIIDKALAVGRIDPRKEISVKSKIPGIVRRTFVDIGDYVKKGDPLIDVAPDPTPIEYAEASRQVELSQVVFNNAKREYDRSKTLENKQLISNQEFEDKRALYDEAELRLKLAKEKLSLIESGQTTIADMSVDNTIKSPIEGTVLSRLVEEGDPVVPLTTFQAGTELMTLAQMDDLIFKGNVDEIDVGKLHVGQEVEIEIGAIPNQKIAGKLTKISPKAHKEEGSTLFEVEIEIDDTGKNFLRAGYSANADIIITKKVDIVLAPERLVTIEDSIKTVEVLDSLGIITPVEIETGLSDGINIEIVSGVDAGAMLVERPPKEITGE